MKENTEISERIKQLIDFLGVNKNQFAKDIGYDRTQTVYDIVNGKAKPSFDFFNRFINSEYSERVNVEWLIAGKGSITNKKEPVGMVSEPPPEKYASPKESYVESLLILALTEKVERNISSHLTNLQEQIDDLYKQISLVKSH
ncbi:MAG TPA: hypothetical protein ENH91_00095 [Leeuwenhoekiella sp.]|nr:hypothetical protein [Leeuwenhoekiella sp.]